METFSVHHPTDRIVHATAFFYTSCGALDGMNNSSTAPPILVELPFQLLICFCSFYLRKIILSKNCILYCFVLLKSSRDRSENPSLHEWMLCHIAMSHSGLVLDDRWTHRMICDFREGWTDWLTNGGMNKECVCTMLSFFHWNLGGLSPVITDTHCRVRLSPLRAIWDLGCSTMIGFGYSWSSKTSNKNNCWNCKNLCFSSEKSISLSLLSLKI